jgi:uncharacterized membrane protein YedE/YeeE
MTGTYWPWWIGAMALSTVAVGFVLTHGRALGVSGLYARLLNWRGERAAERISQNEERLRTALLEATRRRFGDVPPEGEAGTGPSPDTPARLPVSHGLVFVMSLVFGGALAAALTGRFGQDLSLGASLGASLGGSRATLAVLLLGGILIGFGTRMAGGCTSGHGLSGCSRLQTASLVATASFFGAAVAVSFLMSWWLP